MDLSIIIVSWNVKEKLRENLDTIFKTSPQPDSAAFVPSSGRGELTAEASPSQVEGELTPRPPLSRGQIQFEVFVVDNDSKDGTAEMISKEFPEVKLIANTENLGLGRANNQGIKISQGKYILFLNPDMKVFPDTLGNMFNWMEKNPKTDVAGCHLVDEEGVTVKHVRRFPGFLDQLAIVLKLPHLAPAILKKYLLDDFDYSKPAKVDSIRGAFFMVRNASGFARELAGRSIALNNKSKITLPFFDERYFLWFEEVDYCRQIRDLGGEVWYTPAAECIDHVGQSFKQVSRGSTQKYFKDSMLKYFRKWHPYWQHMILKAVWPIGEFITWIGEKIRYRPKAKT